MAIRFKCTCGNPFEVKDDWAGRKICCLECGALVPIPRADDEVLELKLAEEEEFLEVTLAEEDDVLELTLDEEATDADDK